MQTFKNFNQIEAKLYDMGWTDDGTGRIYKDGENYNYITGNYRVTAAKVVAIEGGYSDLHFPKKYRKELERSLEVHDAWSYEDHASMRLGFAFYG